MSRCLKAVAATTVLEQRVSLRYLQVRFTFPRSLHYLLDSLHNHMDTWWAHLRLFCLPVAFDISLLTPTFFLNSRSSSSCCACRSRSCCCRFASSCACTLTFSFCSNVEERKEPCVLNSWKVTGGRTDSLTCTSTCIRCCLFCVSSCFSPWWFSSLLTFTCGLFASDSCCSCLSCFFFCSSLSPMWKVHLK